MSPEAYAAGGVDDVVDTSIHHRADKTNIIKFPVICHGIEVGEREHWA